MQYWSATGLQQPNWLLMRFLPPSEDSPLSQRSARRSLLSLTTLGSLLCYVQGFRPALALPQCRTSHAVADSAQPSEDADATNAAAAPPAMELVFCGSTLSSTTAPRRRPSAGSRPTTAAPCCPRPRASAHSRAGWSPSSPVAQTLGIWLLSDQYASQIGELDLIEQGYFYTLKLSKLAMCTASPLDWSPGLLNVSIEVFELQNYGGRKS